jgi:hypothetical protein
MVRDVRKGLRKQKENMDNAHKKYADACRKDFNEFERRIDTLEASFEKFKKLKLMDGPVLEDRQQEQKNRKKELEERQEQHDTLVAENDVNKLRYQEVVKEHGEVRSMIHQARAIMKDAFKKG